MKRQLSAYLMQYVGQWAQVEGWRRGLRSPEISVWFVTIVIFPLWLEFSVTKRRIMLPPLTDWTVPVEWDLEQPHKHTGLPDQDIFIKHRILGTYQTQLTNCTPNLWRCRSIWDFMTHPHIVVWDQWSQQWGHHQSGTAMSTINCSSSSSSRGWRCLSGSEIWFMLT